jgi:hypothetical protein
MKNDRASKKEVGVLGAVYVGLLLIVILLPETNPALSGFVLALYAVVSYVAIERVK